jgi:hypothetical protein
LTENALLPPLLAAGRGRNIPVSGKNFRIDLWVSRKSLRGCRPVQKRTRLYRILTPVLPSEWAIIWVLGGFSGKMGG